MKLTNPVGRNVSLNADNDINPRACMCRNGFALSSVLGEITVATVVATVGLGIMVLMLPQQVTQTEQACKLA